MGCSKFDTPLCSFRHSRPAACRIRVNVASRGFRFVLLLCVCAIRFLGRLCFTVVAFHLEPTLPHFCETLNPYRVCLVGRSPLRPALLCGNFRSAFDLFVSRLRALHMCLLDLSHLPVVRACPLSEVLSILLIAICDFSTLSHSVRVDCRMSLLIRQSCVRLVQPSRRCGVSAFGSLVRFAHRLSLIHI